MSTGDGAQTAEVVLDKAYEVLKGYLRGGPLTNAGRLIYPQRVSLSRDGGFWLEGMEDGRMVVLPMKEVLASWTTSKRSR